MARLVKNPPAMQETPVQFLDWEDLLEKGHSTHSNLEGKQRSALSSRATTRISWSPLSGLKGVQPPLPFGETGVGSLSLLQQIFPIQELSRGLLRCRRILYQLN